MTFGGRSFTFEEFRDECVKPNLKPNEDPDEVAEASIDLLIHQGLIEKTVVGEKIWYIRTGKELPPAKP